MAGIGDKTLAKLENEGLTFGAPAPVLTAVKKDGKDAKKKCEAVMLPTTPQFLERGVLPCAGCRDFAALQWLIPVPHASWPISPSTYSIGNTPLVQLQRIPGEGNARRGNVILGKSRAITRRFRSLRRIAPRRP
ncbi:hypothetical protein ACU4GH_34075 [Bradyrhizobium betae]